MGNFFRSPILEFIEETDEFIILARWNPEYEGLFGTAGGFWVGYLGSKGGKEIPHTADFHYGLTCATDYHGITMLGFSTDHIGDVNFGPNGEKGLDLGHNECRRFPRFWTKETVLTDLREVAELLLSIP